MVREEEPIYTEEDAERYSQEQEELRKATDRSFIFKCIAWFCVLVFLLLVVDLLIRNRRRGGGGHEWMRSISNAKQIYLVLMDFEQDYGYFPDDHTALKDPALSRFTGNDSNDYLGQLIAGGYTTSEEIFHALDHRYRGINPDNVITPNARILEKNECGFSYVMVHDKGKLRGLNCKDDCSIPILAAPLVNEWGSCDSSTFNKRGIYLRIDGSARSERLRSSDQKIDLGGGVTLFDPSPTWGSLKPQVLLPER